MNPLLETANKIGDIAAEAVKLELARQGHKLTGALIDSVTPKAREVAGGVIIEGFMLDYGVPVNTGVPASRIPYSSRRGGGGASKYITGLQLFAQLKFRVTKKEALSIAFAIANKHKKEGMPTQSSKRFSKTGKRTGAIQDALASIEDKIEELIQKAVTLTVNGLMIASFKTNIPDVKVS